MKRIKELKVKTKAQQPQDEDKVLISIPPLQIKTIRIILQGMSPLLVNHFQEKSLRQISDDYIAKTNKQVTGKVKTALSAEEEFENALYYMPSSTEKKPKYGIPTSGIKKAAVTAAKRFVEGAKGTVMEGAFFVLEDEAGLTEIICKEGPVMDQRMVRVGPFGNKKPCLRTRARFDKWELSLPIQYRPDVVSPEMLVNLFENAGFSVGLCEYRPEKTGTLGMFCVKRG